MHQNRDFLRANYLETLVLQTQATATFQQTTLNAMGKVAEEENHHPGMHLTNYRDVCLDLYTHKLQGITKQDIALAIRPDNEVEVTYSSVSSIACGSGLVLLRQLSCSRVRYLLHQLKNEKSKGYPRPGRFCHGTPGMRFPLCASKSFAKIMIVYLSWLPSTTARTAKTMFATISFASCRGNA